MSPFRYFEVMVPHSVPPFRSQPTRCGTSRGGHRRAFGYDQCRGTSPKRYHSSIGMDHQGFTRLDFKGNSRSRKQGLSRKKCLSA